MADCDEFSYAAFHEWFKPGFVALVREILDDAIEDLDTGRADLSGRLEHFPDILIANATIVSLYQNTTDVYAVITLLPPRSKLNPGTHHHFRSFRR